MTPITLVTAFFDIGREHFENTDYTRSNDQYFDYFAFWARMRNPLVVYTAPEFADRVRAIRAGFGLEKQTTVIPVENPFAIEPELYTRMQKISQDEDFRKFRLYPNAMSNRADYDYIMLLKYWCMADATSRGITGSQVAWIDFGFNHGGVLFPNPEEFDFEWRFAFSPKIHLFSLQPCNTASSLISLQFFPEIIMGPLIIAPSIACEALWKLTLRAMESLVMLGAIDDDQQLLLMAYQYQPDLFEVHLSDDWFLPLKEYGGSHLTVRQRTPAPTENVPPPTIGQKVKGAIKRLLKRGQPTEETSKVLFFRRLEQLADKYHQTL